jgi:hypothetical protein
LSWGIGAMQTKNWLPLEAFVGLIVSGKREATTAPFSSFNRISGGIV